MASLLGLVAIVLAAWFGINATDEPLSGEARAALVVPPLPAPAKDNGFLDFLVLAAPEDTSTAPPWGELKIDPRIQRCAFGATSREADGRLPCLDAAAAEPRLRELLEDHRVYLGRYRAMREKPRFINLFAPQSPEDPLPAYQEMLEGQRLTILGAALRFNGGDRAGAVRELERDAAFYRKMLADATTLIDKMIAVAAQDRSALFVAELARRMPPGDPALWSRLESVVRPPTKEELDLLPALRREIANKVRWMQTRRYVRIPKSSYDMMETYTPEAVRMYPRWDPVAPYLYRPRQSVNWYAARCRILLAVADHPSTEYLKAQEAARSRARAIDPSPVVRLIFNPAGWNHPYFYEGCDETDYIGRLHARAGVQTLARLLVKLRGAGITSADRMTAALAGPLGRAHADPFTGKPMRFDPKTETIGFEADERLLSGVMRPIRARYGRVAMPI